MISVGNELNSCLQTFGDCCAVEKIGADLPKKEELYGCMEKSGIVFDEKKGRSILLLLILSAMGIFLLAGTAIRRGADQAAEDVRQSMTSGLKLERIMNFILRLGMKMDWKWWMQKQICLQRRIWTGFFKWMATADVIANLAAGMSIQD